MFKKLMVVASFFVILGLLASHGLANYYPAPSCSIRCPTPGYCYMNCY